MPYMQFVFFFELTRPARRNGLARPGPARHKMSRNTPLPDYFLKFTTKNKMCEHHHLLFKFANSIAYKSMTKKVK